MTLKITRRIRGNLQGSIDLSELEDLVIAHPIFQRLRRIKQTAFLGYVFPGATHTRFEHSLGVMYQASLAWNKLRDNQMRLYHTSLEIKNFAAKEQEIRGGPVHGLLAPTFDQFRKLFASDYTLQTLRLAALLHDVGHPPFSHSGERFLPSLSDLMRENDLPDYLHDYLHRLEDKKKSAAKKHELQASHEIYTLLLVDRILTDIYKDRTDLSLVISPRDVISVIAPGIAPMSNSELITLEANKLCHELVSGEIDIDRMDYLLRDSRECGVVYGFFDLDRIMDSLSLYYNQEDKRLHLAIQYSGLAAFEDYLRARQSMYMQLYFHKTSVACEAMLQHLSKRLGNWKLPAAIDRYVELDEHSIHQHLLEAGKAAALSDAEFNTFRRLASDLLRDRRLWKRVYEVIQHSPSYEEEDVRHAMHILAESGFVFERVSSRNALTKFRSRQPAQKSRNYLRLIKKDERQFPRVVPIEDYSTLLSPDNIIQIDRIYIEESAKTAGGEDEVQRAKRVLMDALFT